MKRATFRFLQRVGLGLFLGSLLLTYAGGWWDLVRTRQVGEGIGGVLAAVPASVSYWAMWVLPLWWLTILIVTAGCTLLALAARAFVLWAIAASRGSSRT